jgi:hypothetical protein
MTGPAFSLPAPPAGWAGTDLVRLVDPTGDAIAWLVPERGALCAAFHVREANGEWRLVLGVEPNSDEAFGITIAGEIARLYLLTRDPTSCELAHPNHDARVSCAIVAGWLVLDITLGPARFGSRVSVSFGAAFGDDARPGEVVGDVRNVETGTGAIAADVFGTMTVRIG